MKWTKEEEQEAGRKAVMYARHLARIEDWENNYTHKLLYEDYNIIVYMRENKQDIQDWKHKLELAERHKRRFFTKKKVQTV